MIRFFISNYRKSLFRLPLLVKLLLVALLLVFVPIVLLLFFCLLLYLLLTLVFFPGRRISWVRRTSYKKSPPPENPVQDIGYEEIKP